MGSITNNGDKESPVSLILLQAGPIQSEWPSGSYCILMAGGRCPNGFSTKMGKYLPTIIIQLMEIRK